MKARKNPASNREQGTCRQKNQPQATQAFNNLNFTVDDIIRDYSVQTPLGREPHSMGTVESHGVWLHVAPQRHRPGLFSGT